jgi:hypothetical protein
LVFLADEIEYDPQLLQADETYEACDFTTGMDEGDDLCNNMAVKVETRIKSISQKHISSMKQSLYPSVMDDSFQQRLSLPSTVNVVSSESSTAKAKQSIKVSSYCPKFRS